MISPKPRGWSEKVEYVIVERDGLAGNEQQGDFNATPTPTIDQILQNPYTRREESIATGGGGDDSDDEDDSQTTFTTATPSSGGLPPVRSNRSKQNEKATNIQ